MSNASLGALVAYASMLMQKTGVKIVIGGSQPSTNGKTIWLGGFPVGIKSFAQAFAYAVGKLVHEVAHVLYTDFVVYKNAASANGPTFAGLLNLLEDIRIELLVVKLLPGTRFSLASMVQQCMADGYWAAPQAGAHPMSLMQAFMLYRLRTDVLQQSALSDYADTAEQLFSAVVLPGIFTRLDVLMFKVELCKSTTAVVSLVTEILEMIEDEKDKAQQQQQQQQNQQQSGSGSGSQQQNQAGEDDDSSGNSNPGASDDSDADATQESGSNDDNSTPSDADADDHNGDGSDQSDDDLQQGIESAQQLLSAGDGENVDGIGEVASQFLQSSSQQGSNVSVFDSIDVSTAENAAATVSEVAMATNAVRRRCSALFEASGMTRRWLSDKGKRISPRHYPNMRHGDMKVFQNRQVGIDTSAAIQVLVDASSSMAAEDRIAVAREAALAVAYAFEGVRGLSVATAAFPVPQLNGDDGVGVMTRFGQSVRNTAGRYTNVHAYNCTPMTQALTWSWGELSMQSDRDRKILLVLTDGGPDDFTSAKAVIEDMTRDGIEVLGLGIKIEVDHLFPVSGSITQIGDLAQTMFSMLQNQLLSDRKAA